MTEYTREYPKDIKPLVMSKDERIFYDEAGLLAAGYEKKGTLKDFLFKIEIPVDAEVARFAHMLPVWEKGDTLIVLTDHENGTFGFGGWLKKHED